MKNVALIILWFIPAFCFAQTTTDFVHLNQAQSDVWQVIQAWNDAFARNDPESYFEFIHQDLTLFTPAGAYRIDGKGNDREEFEYSLNKGWTKVGYFQELQPHVTVYGNTAIVTYHNRGTYGTGDKEAGAYLKETDVLIKIDSQWKIWHIHVSN